ncbi:GGDEF domain-containing protein [Jiella sp. M17.18]|uniref:GGDEF domain-containing protein n=1 Tax=Jiella sp. M17.18 TaxID=3234247 RepID=UPI0034DEFC30
MQFDVTTMLLLMAGTCTIASGAMLMEWRKGGEPALAWWSPAFLVIGIGSALTPLRQIGLDVLAIGLSNALTIGGYGGLFAGIASFTGHRKLTALWPLGCIVWLLFWLFSPLSDDVFARIVVQSFSVVVYSAVAGVLLLQMPRANALVKTVGWVFTIRAVFFAVRIAMVSLSGSVLDARLMTGFSFTSVMFEGVLASVLLGYLLLAVGRDRREVSLKRLAETDFLTGIDNRRAFALKARVALALAPRRTNPNTSLLIIDIDNFKRLNDTHGHAFGDEVLQMFAAIVAGHLGPADLFARLGGEEFAVLLPGQNVESATRTANAIRRSFAEAADVIDGRSVKSTVSIGIASAAEAGSLDTLTRLADGALYRAKSGGRNKVIAAEPEAEMSGSQPCSQTRSAAPA